jgi:flagellar protein FlbT
MSGLVLKLKPFEKFLVNGVVMQNGQRAAQLRIQSPNAAVLRMRDAIRPEEALTPFSRIYYIAQLAVAGEASAEQARVEIIAILDNLHTQSMRRADDRERLAGLRDAVEAGKMFSAMRIARKLFDPASASAA